jgi:LysM repeat protein
VPAAVALAALVPLVAVADTASAGGFACSSGGATYTVAAGDSWYAIAGRAGVGADQLLAANGASVSDSIFPGDVLCLPNGASAPTSCASRYTVRSGDGWSRIADAAGVSTKALLAVNGATASTTIHPGDTLCLPAGAAAPSSPAGSSTPAAGAKYAVAAGDSWFRIAERHGVTMSALLAVNGATARTLIVVGQQIVLPAGASATPAPSGASAKRYTVVAGDSWYAIATRAGVSTRSLLGVNNANAATVLLPGQSIALPANADTGALARSAPDRASVRLQALPVQGPCGYADTWMAARSQGRRHEGIDMFAARGQYVYAVVDGTLTARRWDQPGRRAGNAWWLRSADGTATFFYAHLLDFAPGLQAGSRVKAGQIIGFVGATGNAGGVHLHFEIHPGGGDAVNPYPIVKAAGGCNWDTPYKQPGGWVPDRIG